MPYCDKIPSWLRKVYCKLDQQCGCRTVGDPRKPDDDSGDECDGILRSQTSP